MKRVYAMYEHNANGSNNVFQNQKLDDNYLCWVSHKASKVLTEHHLSIDPAHFEANVIHFNKILVHYSDKTEVSN